MKLRVCMITVVRNHEAGGELFALSLAGAKKNDFIGSGLRHAWF